MNSFNLSESLFGQPATPIAQFLRQELLARTRHELDIVDQCSTSYAVGQYAGMILGDKIFWGAGLNGGANSMFWSGGKLAKAEAAGRGISLKKNADWWIIGHC